MISINGHDARLHRWAREPCWAAGQRDALVCTTTHMGDMYHSSTAVPTRDARAETPPDLQ